MFSPCDNCKANCAECEFDKALKDLSKYDQAEREERLVILPCQVDKTAWRICQRGEEKPFLREVVLNEYGIGKVVVNNEIGRIVFATKEEAMRKIAEG